MKIEIYITLKNGVLDPQGKAIENSLAHLGFNDVDNVRQGKLIELDIPECSEQDAKQKIDDMCANLLVNQVIENYTYKLV